MTIKTKKNIRPYFDCDMDGHSSNENDINITLKHIQDTIRDLFRPICAYKIMIAVSSVHKSTKKGYKLSVHCVAWNIQMSIDNPYNVIHDNIEMLELLHFDCSVYKWFKKHQKFRCVNTFKEGEGIECLLTPVTYVHDLKLNLIQ